LDVLPISLSRDPPPAKALAIIKGAERMTRELQAKRGPERISGLMTSDGPVAWSFLQAATQYVTSDAPTFCEWGSGIGSVTCMARCRGWTASGIEIEPRLIDKSRELAAAHNIDVAFHACSYKPEGLFDHTSRAADFDTGLGFSLFDFDIIYAYLWLAESRAVTTAISQHAPEGTIFLRYSGGVTCDAFRVNGGGAYPV
jgi:hypothetical protein